jgi:hypothetical protein
MYRWDPESHVVGDLSFSTGRSHSPLYSEAGSRSPPFQCALLQVGAGDAKGEIGVYRTGPSAATSPRAPVGGRDYPHPDLQVLNGGSTMWRGMRGWDPKHSAGAKGPEMSHRY